MGKQLMIKNKSHIRKDDKVKIVAGKDKDKIGKVLRVDRKRGRILVENINFVKRHSRPTSQNRQGGIIEKEAPVHLSNVIMMCNKCVKPSRIQMKRLEDGRKVRVCIKCGEAIDS
jgi:large subunit ribosomal protein L24